METTYRKYMKAMTVSETNLKGLFRWFFSSALFALTYMVLFGANNCNFYVIVIVFGCLDAYQVYDGYVNRPNLLSVLPLSDKKRLLYSYIRSVTSLISLIVGLMVFILVSCLFDLNLQPEHIFLTLRSSFPDNVKLLSMGNLLPIIMALGVYFTAPALAFIRDKKQWYFTAGAIYALNLAWGLFFCAYGEKKFKPSIAIEERFASKPHHEIIFIIFCIFTVLEIAAGAFLAYKMINKKAK